MGTVFDPAGFETTAPSHKFSSYLNTVPPMNCSQSPNSLGVANIFFCKGCLSYLSKLDRNF